MFNAGMPPTQSETPARIVLMNVYIKSLDNDSQLNQLRILPNGCTKQVLDYEIKRKDLVLLYGKYHLVFVYCYSKHCGL